MVAPSERTVATGVRAGLARPLQVDAIADAEASIGPAQLTRPAPGVARTDATAGTGGQSPGYSHASNHCDGSRCTIGG